MTESDKINFAGDRHLKYLDVYRDHTGLVSDKWTQYFFIYDRIFSRFQAANRPIKILEIGVQNGGSLEIWKKYFPAGSEIHGVDIDEKCAELSFSDGITFHLGSATDADFIAREFSQMEFDIILDDGSHFCPDVVNTFFLLFSQVKPGGVYVAEDMQCSYWSEFGGGFGKTQSSIEFFKALIDCLSLRMLRLSPEEVTAIKGTLAFLEKYERWISEISFFDGVVKIEKFHEPRTLDFIPVRVGETASVVANILNVRPAIATVAEAVEKIRFLYEGAL